MGGLPREQSALDPLKELGTSDQPNAFTADRAAQSLTAQQVPADGSAPPGTWQSRRNPALTHGADCAQAGWQAANKAGQPAGGGLCSWHGERSASSRLTIAVRLASL